MDIDSERVIGLFERMKELRQRADEVISNAEKARHPYDSLSDSQRLFCAFTAHSGKTMLAPAATKLGLDLDADYGDENEHLASKVAETYQSWGPSLGTMPEMVEAAYINGAELLIDAAESVIVRAERVLNGQGSINCRNAD